MVQRRKKLIVIGGGAAGFFCAVNAARMNPGLDVVILEKSKKVLSKVRVSGGGRCNVTHACFDVDEMIKRYPRGNNFVRKSLHQFFTKDTISWFEERGVELKTESDGRMFPSTNSSQTIIDVLLREANLYGVTIRLNSEVKEVAVKYHGDSGKETEFILSCSNGEVLQADYLCIASGGYPKTPMFEWLTKLGHSIEEPVPSLFTFNMPQHPITELMGVSVEHAKVKISGTKLEQEGPLLITHWGLSGPAVLRLSAWAARQLAMCNWQFSILINWLPQTNEQSLLKDFQRLRLELASQKISNRNPFGLPHRLWDFFLNEASVTGEMRWADLPAKTQNKLVQLLCAYRADIKGKTTFKEEFVTAGGVRLSEIDANTMMSRKIQNLFFAGEVMDVDGITGGFNFQHAWTSGFIAARAVADSEWVPKC
jgi:predicted Rossmann fold flavoprotein